MDFYISEASYSFATVEVVLFDYLKTSVMAENGRSDYNHFITFTESARHLKCAIMQSDRGLFIL
jgi:hypothetical protein